MCDIERKRLIFKIYSYRETFFLSKKKKMRQYCTCLKHSQETFFLSSTNELIKASPLASKSLWVQYEDVQYCKHVWNFLLQLLNIFLNQHKETYLISNNLVCKFIQITIPQSCLIISKLFSFAPCYIRNNKLFNMYIYISIEPIYMSKSRKHVFSTLKYIYNNKHGDLSRYYEALWT